ncbi:unnamed protein product [Bursaphelenchus okinawaensis]|uniref:Apple domain-containing protein n=1 Tax=Bursaphelenchus okinawaensis TaxID=465554 RepID=A0A811JWR5_9BILA|nr:unnamed protein product [Bursaphelenchus okinawaensis]CAG9086575.1 unnamed protein product [Bursaphelenchus okinawaensis]
MKLVLLVLLTALSVNGAVSRENHFGEPCALCGCFIEYTDRDVGMGRMPFKVASHSYDITEDKCLAGCLQDSACKMAVYGFVGGRSVFSCEYYDLIDVQKPIYVPYTNIYLKRTSACQKELSKYPQVQAVQSDAIPLMNEEVSSRKQREMRMNQRTNPFAIGK